MTACATCAEVKSYRPTVSVSAVPARKALSVGQPRVGAGAERDGRLRLDRVQGHAGRAAVAELGFDDRRQLGVRRRGRRRMGTRQRPLVGEVRYRAQVRCQPEAGRVLLRVLQFQGLFRGRLPNVHRHPAHLGGQHLALRGLRDFVPDRDDDGLRIGQPVLRDLEARPDGQHPGLVESRHVLLDDGIDVRQVNCHISHPRLESGRYTLKSVASPPDRTEARPAGPHPGRHLRLRNRPRLPIPVIAVSAVTPAPPDRAAAAGRIIGCKNSPYRGCSDTQSRTP